MKKKLFLWVYKFRKKVCYLIKKIPRGKNTVQRDLSACVEERFNIFELAKILAENLTRQKYRFINIAYKPVSKINQTINCYFTTSMRNAYREVSRKNNVSTTADQCFGCNKFFIKRNALERHMKVCGHIPGITYIFENQNIQTFFNNMKFMGDIPFSIYFDLETTTGKKIYNFDEDATLYSVSYAFVVAFHPSLKIEKIPVVRRFNHTFEQLNDVNYLSDEILPYIDPITTRQQRDYAVAVFNKKEKYLPIEMFFCELKFVIDLLKKWLAEKYFSRYKELDLFSKQRFKRENPIDWNETNCVICGFRLPTAVSNFPNEKRTTILDFVIEKEHYFI